tara:strand:- start:359 stop:583 length:225 start_codon:yes stop_codon:yes gene_type:complete
MKQSTKFAIVLVLSLVWIFATILGISDNLLKLNTPIEMFMVLTPFISFFGTLVAYHLEYKDEVSKDMHISDKKS